MSSVDQALLCDEHISDTLGEVYNSESLHWIQDGIATCIVPQKVWKLLQSDEFALKGVEPLPQQIIAGPGVLWAYLANLNMWLFFVGFTYLATFESSCSGTSSQGYAEYPSWLWGIFFVGLSFSLFCELRCLGYVLVPQLQVTSRFSILCVNFSEMPFEIWLIFVMLMSIVCHLDFATNALFTATTLKTMSTCIVGDQIEEVWHQVLDQAYFYFRPPFATLANIGWWLMIFQIIFAIFDAVPLVPCMVDYCVGYGRSFTFRYRTLLAPDQNHGAALVTLQNACRMMSNTFQAEKFAKDRFYGILESRDVNWETRCNHHVRGILNRGILTFGLVGIGESAYYLNLQISLAAVNCAVTGQSFFQHWQICLSVCLSILMAVKRTYDAVLLIIDVMNAMDNYRKALRDTAQDLVTLERHMGEVDEANNWRLRLLVSLFTIYTLTIIYAAVKFTAIAACPYSTWNLSGCVILEGDFKPSLSSPHTIMLTVAFSLSVTVVLVLVTGYILLRFFCCQSDDEAEKFKDLVHAGEGKARE
eukprot:TRINITY_DN68774_c0_g1_i1.p1 TRINITY_DN68774_c0_g1~~TRINITY_DN68774_c0_g1_i1.p1  ORF type:complete len:531 (+),score=59.64 TRINITY_DN68774_c0_g1_i1:168-1760(+)